MQWKYILATAERLQPGEFFHLFRYKSELALRSFTLNCISKLGISPCLSSRHSELSFQLKGTEKQLVKMDKQKSTCDNDSPTESHSGSVLPFPGDESRQRSMTGSAGQEIDSSEGGPITNDSATIEADQAGNASPAYHQKLRDGGFQRIVRNFTPS